MGAAMPDSVAAPAGDVHECGQCGAHIQFRDLDCSTDLDGMMARLRSSTSRNFVVDFSDEASHAAFDLDATSMAQLLALKRPDTSVVRWINVWSPYHQQSLLHLLATRYDFSPRLLGLMCSDPCVRPPLATTSRSERVTGKARASRRATQSTLLEVEKGSDELNDLASVCSGDSVARGNLYRIVDDVWHYTSVDFGRSYVCIGYNSLYGTKPIGGLSDHEPLPHCTRVWTWLVLCEDNTIITVNEDPFPYAGGKLDVQQYKVLHETRRNLIHVFRSLSRVNEASRMANRPLTVLPLRTRLGSTPEETAHRESDAPALLFYYLFENLHNSYMLVTRKASRYGVELDDVRSQMFEQPRLCHIDRLDTIGKELSVLKRHYQGYNRIVDRLLEPQSPTAASLQNSHIVSTESQVSLDTVRPFVTEGESALGVPLSSAAQVRFRRLKDSIDLYALSEVDAYLARKESLIALNFNLIAMRESLAMERLTKVALLITKATVLFLPVSYMSSYFSVNLGNEQYTVKQYWISFAVVLACSWTVLFVFGVFSGSLQTTEVFAELWSGLYKAWTSLAMRDRRRR
ncbi:hypothetical protein LTR53_014598 [Teratosphaeriaceae sp. CCFEE 6253]|nr:hypothetical protein LTR53_014598 [Teratosphaeriaceae sp. CCFEE 6253]